ncbi:MAG: hypothetical protein LDL09_07340, partial [Calditerrivibrio sp.]|nr:hypothetical protein [Calditerrivibrio sp.]
MANLIPLLKDKKLFATLDGSISCYNISYGEAYHAKSVGAFSESFYKYAKASNIKERLAKGDVKLLDVGFGLGYNLAVTINETLECSNNLYITSLEKDPHMVEIVHKLKILWPWQGFKILRKLLSEGNYKNYFMNIQFTDATIFLKNCFDIFDIIYFDPFSKSKNAEMWSKETLQSLYNVLSDNGLIVTYACSK